MCVCVCVRACVRACVRVCVCVDSASHDQMGSEFTHMQYYLCDHHLKKERQKVGNHKVCLSRLVG